MSRSGGMRLTSKLRIALVVLMCVVGALMATVFLQFHESVGAGPQPRLARRVSHETRKVTASGNQEEKQLTNDVIDSEGQGLGTQLAEDEKNAFDSEESRRSSGSNELTGEESRNEPEVQDTEGEEVQRTDKTASSAQSGPEPGLQCSATAGSETDFHFLTEVSKALEYSTNIERGLAVYTQFATPLALPGRQDVSLVTYSSLDSLEHLAETIKDWTGPVSCSVILDRSEQQLQRLAQSIRKPEFRSTSFHAVMRSAHSGFVIATDVGFSLPKYLNPVMQDALLSGWSVVLENQRNGIVIPSVRSDATHSQGAHKENQARSDLSTSLFQNLQSIIFHNRSLDLSTLPGRPAILISKRGGLAPLFSTNKNKNGTCLEWAATLLSQGYDLLATKQSSSSVDLSDIQTAFEPRKGLGLKSMPPMLQDHTQDCEEVTSPVGRVRQMRCAQHVVTSLTAVNTGALPLSRSLVVFPNWIQARRRAKRDEVTMVTQTGVKKLSRLLLLARRWSGPISVVVVLGKDDIDDLADMVLSNQNKLSQTSIHLVLGEIDPHPINHARNVGIETIESDYFLLLDVDFMPNPGLHRQLKQRLRADPEQSKGICHRKRALIVPAFAQHPYRTDEGAFLNLPRNKENLLQLLASDDMTSFEEFENPSGHGPTNFRRWTSLDASAAPYSVDWELRFEPYVVLEKGFHRSTPALEGKFSGYGRNKLSWIAELYYAGYQFEVLPEGFLVHMYHPGRTGRQVRDEIWEVYFEWEDAALNRYLACSPRDQLSWWPRLFLIGAPKAGTRSLVDVLLSHPQICQSVPPGNQDKIPNGKPHFFDVNYFRGTQSYLEQFSGNPHCYGRDSAGLGFGKQAPFKLDATPHYLTSQDAVDRMYNMIPQALHHKLRFIVLLRDPIARDLTAFNHAVRAKKLKWIWPTGESYHEYVSSNIERHMEGHAKEVSSISYGLYHQQLEYFWTKFPRNQTLVLSLDMLRSDLSDQLDRIASFLEIPEDPFLRTKRFPHLKSANPNDVDLYCVPSETAELLHNFYDTDTRALFKLLAKEGSPRMQPELRSFEPEDICGGTKKIKRADQYVKSKPVDSNSLPWNDMDKNIDQFMAEDKMSRERDISPWTNQMANSMHKDWTNEKGVPQQEKSGRVCLGGAICLHTQFAMRGTDAAPGARTRGTTDGCEQEEEWGIRTRWTPRKSTLRGPKKRRRSTSGPLSGPLGGVKSMRGHSGCKRQRNVNRRRRSGGRTAAKPPLRNTLLNIDQRTCSMWIDAQSAGRRGL